MLFWTFIKHRFSRVLKPFLAIILLIYFASISFSKISLLMASRRLFKAIYANGYYLDWVQLWFLPHLLVVGLFAYFFFKVVTLTRVFQLLWVILVIMYVAGIVSIKLFWPFEFNLLGKDFTFYGLHSAWILS